MPDDERRDDEPQEETQPEETQAGADAEGQEAKPDEPEAQEEPGAEETADVPEAEGSEEPEADATEGPEAEATEEPEPEATKEPEKREQPAKAKDVPPGAELEPIKLEPQRELSAEERARVEAEAEERARAEAEATAEAGEEPEPAREAVVDLDSDARIQATGKRKTSIARVVLRAGSGEFQINKRTVEDYFPRHQHQTFVRQPLLTSGYEGKVDVRVRVHGGGIAGQAGAVRHGIARALTEIDPELRGELKKRGLLTRDARAKERRKAGLKKARKRPQFSKR
jgi:small subunit ribosomal protein S9